MNFETVVNDVKTRLEDVGVRAQGVAQISVDTFRQANDIVVPAVQTIVRKNGEAARSFIASGRSSLDKVRIDGLKAVAANPGEYLPARDQFVLVFNDSVEVTTKAGEELFEVLKQAYETVLARLNGDAPVATATRTKVKAAARKTTRTAKTTAKRATRAADGAAKRVTKAANGAARSARKTTSRATTKARKTVAAAADKAADKIEQSLD